MSEPPVPIMIPVTSVAVTDGTIAEWLAADGDRVIEGQPIYLLETDKLETEVSAPASGTIRTSGVTGTTYPVGTVIGNIEPTGTAS